MTTNEVFIDDDFGDILEKCAPKGESITYPEMKTKLSLLRNKIENPAITVEEAYEKYLIKGSAPAISTGIEWFDTFTGKIRRGNTYCIAGYPGSGKTTLALNIAWALALNKVKVWYFCLELSSDEVFEVLAGHIAKNAMVTQEEMAKAYAVIKPTDFRFYEPKKFEPWQTKLEEILHTVRNESIEVVFIDNLSFLVRTDRNATEAEGLASSHLKALAQELEIPIFLLHHLRKPESDMTEPEPNMHSMKGSGSILADASDAFILHHPLSDDEGILRDQVGYILSGKPRWGRGGKRYVRLEGDQRTYYSDSSSNYSRRKRKGRVYE